MNRRDFLKSMAAGTAGAMLVSTSRKCYTMEFEIEQIGDTRYTLAQFSAARKSAGRGQRGRLVRGARVGVHGGAGTSFRGVAVPGAMFARSGLGCGSIRNGVCFSLQEMIIA